MSKTFRYLHITDRHCGASQHHRHWQTHKHAFFEDLDWCLSNNPLHAVLFTGDIANKAQVSEYAEATQNLYELKEFLSKRSAQRKLPVYLIIVPGNHDVQRKLCDKKLRDAIANFKKDDNQLFEFYENTHHTVRGRINEIFNNYTQWSKYIHSNSGFDCPAEVIDEDKEWPQFPGERCYFLKFEGVQISFTCINSSWSHVEDCKAGEIVVRSQQISNVIGHNANTFRQNFPLRILLTHHPVNWLSNSLEFQTYISSNFHIHLSGHTHETRAQAIHRIGISNNHYQVVGRSMLSEAHLRNPEDNPSILYMGYSIGEIDIPELDKIDSETNNQNTNALHAQFRLMPRRFYRGADGSTRLDKDPDIETRKVSNNPGLRSAVTDNHLIDLKHEKLLRVICTITEDADKGDYIIAFDRTIKSKKLNIKSNTEKKTIAAVIDENRELEITTTPQKIGPRDLLDHPQNVPGVFIQYEDARISQGIE